MNIEAITCDLHPGYLSTSWAKKLATQLNVPLVPIQHHLAHATSLITELEEAFDEQEPIIACCFDGTGYGPDEAIWGGEFLVTDGLEYRRTARLEYFLLPGGDASIKHPYRTALSLLWQNGVDWDNRIPSVKNCSAKEQRILKRQLDNRFNCVETSSMGRLFDAIASLIGIRHTVSYEAQAAMEMETLASTAIQRSDSRSYCFGVNQSRTKGSARATTIDCGPLLRSVCHDLDAGIDIGCIAARFHRAVANLIGIVCDIERNQTGLDHVGLTGGVFQNALLLELACHVLRERGFKVHLHSKVPANDGGLSLGQAAAARKLISAER